MYAVSLWGYDEETQRETLLERNDFADKTEARECERRLVRSGAGIVTFNAGAAYVVSIYGDDPQAGPDALLEVSEFTSGLDAVRYIAGNEGTGKRAELAAQAG